MRDSLKKAKQKYRKSKVKIISLDLLRDQEADVIDKLESVPSKKQYIVGLVREDIRKDKDEEKKEKD